MKLVPRDYQVAGHWATWNYIHENHGKNPLVIEPTGTGKSLQMAMFIWGMLSAYPSTRIISLAHVKELVDGNYKELLSVWPAAPAGVYSAGLNERNHRSQVTFAGIQSVRNRAALFKHIDFVIVDEAHSISDKDNTSYVKFINDLRDANPHLVVIGYTATGFRSGSGLLTEGELFDEVAFDLSDGDAFVWLIENGYLARPVPRNPGFELDSDAIRVQAGDFDNKQTSQAMHDQNILERAVDTCIALGVEQNRKAWLHFCQSIEDAELVADMFTYKGHPHEAVHSKRGDRDEVLKCFREGGLRGVTNMDILTTGYNQRNIDLIGAMRLTRSPVLWVQIVGRGTRPVYAPGYDTTTVQGRLDAMLASDKGLTCLVLDFVGNTKRLGPINYPRIPARRGTKAASNEMVRMCPKCSTYSHISSRYCDECEYEFPPPERLQDKASDSELVKTNTIDLNDQPPPPPPKEYIVEPVHNMISMHHKGKKGKPDTMRVDYVCGFARYSTWICFAHPEGSFPRRKAEEWWMQHGGQGEAPDTVDGAVQAAANLNKPKFIKVEVSGKYKTVEGYDFRGTRFELPPEAGGPPLQDPGPDPLAVVKPEGKLLEAMGLGSNYEIDDIPF